MKKKIFNKTVMTGLIISTALVFSCSDEFVKISPEYSIDSENYFNSEDDYYNALVAAYDLLQATYVNVIMGEFASDNTLCGGENQDYSVPTTLWSSGIKPTLTARKK